MTQNATIESQMGQLRPIDQLLARLRQALPQLTFTPDRIPEIGGVGLTAHWEAPEPQDYFVHQVLIAPLLLEDAGFFEFYVTSLIEKIQLRLAQFLHEGPSVSNEALPLEVDYVCELADEPTFTEALAALEMHKARRQLA